MSPVEVTDRYPMTAERIAAERRYRKGVLIAMSAYSILILAAVWLIRHTELPFWVKCVLALIPVVPVAAALNELLRFIASQDELERRVQFEAAAKAAIFTCFLTFAWGLLEIAGLPRLPVVMVLPIFGGSFGLTVALANRRYK